MALNEKDIQAMSTKELKALIFDQQEVATEMNQVIQRLRFQLREKINEENSLEKKAADVKAAAK